MRTLGVVAQVVAGLLGLTASSILTLTNFGILTEEAEVRFDSVYFALGLASAAFYVAVMVLAPSVWSSPHRRRWSALLLGGVIVTMGFSGGSAGIVLFAPSLIILAGLLMLPIRSSPSGHLHDRRASVPNDHQPVDP